MSKSLIYPMNFDNFRWVMLAETDDVTVVRLFTENPTGRITQEQEETLPGCTIEVFPCGIDIFDDNEMDT